MKGFDACRMVIFSLTLSALGLAGAPAQAQFAGDKVTFTKAEEEMIRKNPDFAAARAVDPWLVRHVLTMLPSLVENGGATVKEMPLGQAGAGLTGIDDEEAAKFQRRNPSIQKTLRSSPEAAHDLLVLIRNAAKQGGGHNQ